MGVYLPLQYSKKHARQHPHLSECSVNESDCSNAHTKTRVKASLSPGFVLIYVDIIYGVITPAALIVYVVVDDA
jgi:hypothetical protein